MRNAALAIDQGRGSNLNGEREILDGNLQLCLANPASLPLRVLMAQTLWTMRFCPPGHPARVPWPGRLLQREHPSPNRLKA